VAGYLKKNITKSISILHGNNSVPMIQSIVRSQFTLDMALARRLAAFSSSCFFAKRSAKEGPDIIANPRRSSEEEMDLSCTVERENE